MTQVKEFFNKNSYLLVFLITLFIYSMSAGTELNKQSKTPQYIYLANSFLHGKANLDPLPRSSFDLILFNNKWYVPGGMTPALLLMPFVAIFGITISDILFGVIVGVINTTLMYQLLGDLGKSKQVQIWLTALFGFGTIHWWVSSVGSVWFNAHLVALLFMILFIRATLKDKPWQAGLFFSLAVLSRPPILFSFLFYILFNYFKYNNSIILIKKIIPFGIMLGIGLAVMLTYNQLRFGNPLDFGYGYVQGTNSLTSAYAKTGGFNISYMPCNIYISILGTPNISTNSLSMINKVCPHLESVAQTFGRLSNFFNPVGMSIFLTTPAFILIFWATFKEKTVLAAWAGLIGSLLILWMYHTTGWVQFGYRYVLDVTVFIFLLLGVAIKRIGWAEKLLFSASFIMGGIGVYLMYYMTLGLVWNEMFVSLLKSIYHFIR